MMANITTSTLITGAQLILKNLADLENEVDVLQEAADKIGSTVKELRSYDEMEALKQHCVTEPNEEKLGLLKDNLELKTMLEEYQTGIEHIMAKYREHCTTDVLNQGYELRETYLTALAATADKMDERIDNIIKNMQLAVLKEEISEDQMQHLIDSLSDENQALRKELKICNGEHLLKALDTVEKFTQVNQPSSAATSEKVSSLLSAKALSQPSTSSAAKPNKARGKRGNTKGNVFKRKNQSQQQPKSKEPIRQGTRK